MDKKTSKEIDDIVSKIKISMWKESVKITDRVLREIETRLIQTIHDRWEYEDKNKK